MSNVTWITPRGSIGEVIVNLPVSVSILAADPTQSAVTYTLIGGTLPTGLTLSSNGVISGTPTYTDSSVNYFTTEDYNFIVRAASASGALPADAQFTLTVVNIVNNDFNWVTESGALGTVSAGDYVSLQLLAESTSNITYKMISGELPNGMRITDTGYLQGVPTFLTSVAVDQSKQYRFTVRATNAAGHINDRSFNIIVTSVAGPVIEPTTTFLGAFFDGVYFSQQLTVVELNSLASIQWSVTNGQLPPGVTLDSNGLLSGYIQPLQLVGSFGPAGYGAVQEYGEVVTAGQFIPGEHYEINGPSNTSGLIYTGTTDFTQIGADNNNLGTEFIATGVGTGTGTAIYLPTATIIQTQEYDYGPYDFTNLNQGASYNFTIQAFDGANYDIQSYIVEVVSRSGFTADSSTSVNDTYITIDSLNESIPVLLNSSRTLPTARQDAYYAFKFEGYDFAGDAITYSISDVVGTFDAFISGVDIGFDSDGDDVTHLSGIGFDYAAYIAETNTGSTPTNNLPGLTLDANTGWLYGKVNQTNVSLENYSVGIIVSKTVNGVTYSSPATYFTIPILGDVNNVIQWNTASDIGTINNGSVSELFVQATSQVGKEIIYSLYDSAGVPCGLPQGLTLLSSGELSGRVSFEAFSLDDYATTIDGGALTIDRKYTFMVQAQTSDLTANSFREFTVTLNIVDKTPYNNLYLTALPSSSQRQIFNNLISNTNIFDTKEIYRPNDPWFGINTQLEMLFLPGLNPSALLTLENAIVKNHWTKEYQFGDINTAVVLDENYEIKYEVLYINIIDPEENTAGNGPPLELDLNGVITNPYIDINGNTYDVLYPNTTVNMITRLVNAIGYSDQSSLPPWMTSNQPDLTSVNKFQPPLGYTKAVVLAYTQPGASKSIAYRLKNALINFNNIEFSVNSYQLDDYYSTYFDPTTQKYITGQETTFDYLATKNIGSIVARVNYGVDTPFSQINGRPVSYINANGGIDGITDYADGDTIVFLTQENFVNPGPYEGWVEYFDAYIGDNILTTATEGYGSEGFDLYTLIPGYLESITNSGTQNQRGGIWQINMVNGIVLLNFVREVAFNERIQILNGKTHSAGIYYYSAADSVGHTVPYYKIYNITSNAITPPTTFNKGTTKFFSNRDQYYTPNSQDKYVKFPQYGVFT